MASGGRRKSLSSERTYAVDLADRGEIEAEVRRLAAHVAASLARKDLEGRTVSIKVRYSDFTTVSRARTLRTPTADEAVIRETALALVGRTEALQRPVRLLGVGCSNFGEDAPLQLPLFAA